MFHRRPKKPPRLAGDNPLLRAAYHTEINAFPPRTTFPYPDWLHTHGIDPETGNWTERGLAFFKALLEEQNARNRTKRAIRRAA